MANTVIKKAQMIQKLDLGFNWHLLGTNQWATEYGLIKALGDRGKYYKKEKSHKKLWDLLMYCSNSDLEKILNYYDLPTHNFYLFLSFVYNDVAADMAWHKTKGKKEQMDYFPYQSLYRQWIAIIEKLEAEEKTESEQNNLAA